MTVLTLHMTPAPGRRVVDPATRKPLPPEGAPVPASLQHSTYWLRRLAEGDCTCSDLQHPAAAAQAGASTPDQPA